MKSRKIVFVEPGRVECVCEEFDGTLSSPTEVLVKNRYSLISAGTELACLGGLESWFPLPRTPGYGAVGEAIAVGSGVAGVKKGDPVYTFGPHAEHFKADTVSDDFSLCVRIPDGLDAQQAVFTRMASIAMAGLRTSRIELGDWVGVTGLGQVGNLAAQLAQLQGGRVIALDVSEGRLRLAAACGIESPVRVDPKTVREKIMTQTDGAGLSTLIEATGRSAVVQECLPLMARYGEVVLLGSPREPFETDLTDVLNYVHLINRGCVELKGAHEWRYPTRPDPFVKHCIERNAKILFDLIAKGRLRVGPLCTHVLCPEDAAQAYEGLQKHPDDFVGVVFDWE